MSRIGSLKNCVQLELGGSGLIYSLGYERAFLNKRIMCHSGKVGFSLPLVEGINQVFIPVEYRCTIGRNKLKLMAGAGTIFLASSSPFPRSIKSQRDYATLYRQSPYLALNKYGLETFQRTLDIAFIAHLGFKITGKSLDYFVYLNCFYIRFHLEYSFHPIWPAAGLSLKF